MHLYIYIYYSQNNNNAEKKNEEGLNSFAKFEHTNKLAELSLHKSKFTPHILKYYFSYAQLNIK